MSDAQAVREYHAAAVWALRDRIAVAHREITALRNGLLGNSEAAWACEDATRDLDEAWWQLDALLGKIDDA